MNKSTRSAKVIIVGIISERVRFCLVFEQTRRVQVLPVATITVHEWAKLKGRNHD